MSFALKPSTTSFVYTLLCTLLLTPSISHATEKPPKPLACDAFLAFNYKTLLSLRDPQRTRLTSLDLLSLMIEANARADDLSQPSPVLIKFIEFQQTLSTLFKKDQSLLPAKEVLIDRLKKQLTDVAKKLLTERKITFQAHESIPDALLIPALEGPQAGSLNVFAALIQKNINPKVTVVFSPLIGGNSLAMGDYNPETGVISVGINEIMAPQLLSPTLPHEAVHAISHAHYAPYDLLNIRIMPFQNSARRYFQIPEYKTGFQFDEIPANSLNLVFFEQLLLRSQRGNTWISQENLIDKIKSQLKLIHSMTQIADELFSSYTEDSSAEYVLLSGEKFLGITPKSDHEAPILKLSYNLHPQYAMPQTTEKADIVFNSYVLPQFQDAIQTLKSLNREIKATQLFFESVTKDKKENALIPESDLQQLHQHIKKIRSTAFEFFKRGRQD